MKDLEQAFIQLIQQHDKIIYKVLTVYANDRNDKADLYQEILLQLWKAFPSFRADSKPSTWIYRIALNTVVAAFRKSKRQIVSTALNEAVFQMPDWKDEQLEASIQMLYRQINQLNPINKAIVLLYLEEKSYDEIAEITGISVSNVGTKLSRIKQKLRDEKPIY